MANKITTAFLFDTKGGVRSLSDLRTQLKNTDGAFAKLKVGAKGAGDLLKANLAEGAVAAGAALVAFGVKSVNAFQDAALAAGKFSDATGVAVDDASRWIEVAGDVGVGADTIQGAFLRLNKAIGTNSPALEELGVQLQRTSDGSIDTNATMLETIKRLNGVEDQTERARIAQDLFGRGYAEAAEIIFASASDVERKLNDVSDAKVIDTQELERARRFRDAMDDLNDAMEDIALVAGETLVPALSDVAEQVTKVNDAAKDLKLVEPLQKLAKFATETANPYARIMRVLDAVGLSGSRVTGIFKRDVNPTLVETALAFDGVTTATEHYDGAADRAATRVREHAEATEELMTSQNLVADAIAAATEEVQAQAEAAAEAREENRKFADSVFGLHDAEYALEEAIKASNEQMAEAIEAGADTEETMRSIRAGWEDVAEAADRAAQEFVNTQGVEADSAQGQAMWAQQMLKTAGTLNGEMRKAVLDHTARVTGIPTSILTTFGVEVDPGALAALEDLLARLGRVAQNRFATVSAVGTRGGARVDGPDTDRRTGVGATGGIVTQATRAIIGEAGPEAVIPLNKMPGASPLPTGASTDGARVVNITIQAMGSTPEIERMVANAIARYNQRNGR